MVLGIFPTDDKTPPMLGIGTPGPQFENRTGCAQSEPHLNTTVHSSPKPVRNRTSPHRPSLCDPKQIGVMRVALEIKPSGGSRLKTKPPGENHNENKLDVRAGHLQ